MRTVRDCMAMSVQTDTLSQTTGTHNSRTYGRQAPWGRPMGLRGPAISLIPGPQMYNEESSKSTLQRCVEEKPKEGPEDKARQWVQLLAAPVALVSR